MLMLGRGRAGGRDAASGVVHAGGRVGSVSHARLWVRGGAVVGGCAPREYFLPARAFDLFQPCVTRADLTLSSGAVPQGRKMPMFTKLGHKTSTAAKSSGQSAAKATAATAKTSTSSAGKHVLDNTRWQVMSPRLHSCLWLAVCLSGRDAAALGAGGGLTARRGCSLISRASPPFVSQQPMWLCRQPKHLALEAVPHAPGWP